LASQTTSDRHNFTTKTGKVNNKVNIRNEFCINIAYACQLLIAQRDNAESEKPAGDFRSYIFRLLGAAGRGFLGLRFPVFRSDVVSAAAPIKPEANDHSAPRRAFHVFKNQKRMTATRRAKSPASSTRLGALQMGIFIPPLPRTD
jgi:hypothetical protein